MLTQNFSVRQNRVFSRSQTQQQLVDWIGTHDWDLAGTFAFKGETTALEAQKTFKHFWNLVDKAIYGKAAIRYNKRCERACFIEGSDTSNAHYHAILKTPAGIGQDSYIRILELVWQDLGNTGKYGKIEKTNNNVGWANYISKGITAHSTDALDVETEVVLLGWTGWRQS